MRVGGRFDRKVFVDLPDVKGREAILAVHARGKPASSEVSLPDIARLTAGFSGADLENLLNEAAIYAARRNQKTIGILEFHDAFDRIVMGPERKSRVMSQEDKETVAYHEAGHAVVSFNLINTDEPDVVLHSVDIVVTKAGVRKGVDFNYRVSLEDINRPVVYALYYERTSEKPYNVKFSCGCGSDPAWVTIRTSSQCPLFAPSTVPEVKMDWISRPCPASSHGCPGTTNKLRSLNDHIKRQTSFVQ